jgi:predicted lipid-binding transport protein (Tim44 family)
MLGRALLSVIIWIRLPASATFASGRGRDQSAQALLMHDPFDLTTVIFALLAIFVVWKLRSVLGSRTGSERPPIDPFHNSRRRGDESPTGAPSVGTGDDGKVIRLPGAAVEPAAMAMRRNNDPDRWKGLAEPGSKAWIGLDAIAAADPAFVAKAFLDGARAAYEMIVTAFARGDSEALRPLLAPDVYDSFAQAIAERKRRGDRVETTFVTIDRASAEDVQLRGTMAQITVRFLSKMITATYDRTDVVIEGAPGKVVDMVDVWTFARDTGSRDPNWKLVATETGH